MKVTRSVFDLMPEEVAPISGVVAGPLGVDPPEAQESGGDFAAAEEELRRTRDG